MAESVERPDPEVEAGRALRRLRLARGWSQEEVAVRMTTYGYDFHQTMIAKIEGAQRPLRVRELADFAALYGVEVQDLVYPPTGSLPEINEEIAEITTRLDMAQVQTAEASNRLEAVKAAMRNAETAYQAAVTETTVLEGRLATLQAERQKLVGWESDRDPSMAGGTAQTKQEALDLTGPPIAPNAGGPTVLRILLGAQLRRLREARRITAEDAGKVVRASGSKIRRFETGRVGVKDRDITGLLTLYGITEEEERQALRALAQRANAPGWWHDFSDVLPAWFEAYIGLEEAASLIRIYEAQFVPGLLQTEDYARAVTHLGYDDARKREIERRVRLRMARQAVLEREDPPKVWAVLDEAVLRRPLGSPAVMHGQLEHLAEMAQRPNVTIQVLPFQASSHSAAGGPFSILRFAEPDLPDVVYLEQLASALYLDNPDVVNSYLNVMERVCMEALTSCETTQFLRQLITEVPS